MSDWIVLILAVFVGVSIAQFNGFTGSERALVMAASMVAGAAAVYAFKRMKP